MKKVLVVGGGAAGFFAAINIAEKHPEYHITILEKSTKLLSKVKVSGGGRCNVTNGREKPAELIRFYPRGGKKLYSQFNRFSTNDMRTWLEKRGVRLIVESDLRVFPETHSSQTIIDCFMNLARKHNIQILQSSSLVDFHPIESGWEVQTTNAKHPCDYLILATGSSPEMWKILARKGLTISPPVPSLFTFKINDTRINQLPGISFDQVTIRIDNLGYSDIGPLLITHWGLSGPAVLKLSAWAARELSERHYQFSIRINFLPEYKFEQFIQFLKDTRDSIPQKQLSNLPVNLPKRFWTSILHHCHLEESRLCGELSNKQIHQLTEELIQGQYSVIGKSTFKEEFVTCGGIALSEIELKTMNLKKFAGVYCAGEMIDVDALTGGFNFQACWTSAWIISESI